MKKQFFLLTFNIVILTVCAQTWQYYDSLRTNYQEKQSYDTAFVYAVKTLETVKESVGEYDTLFAKMLTSIVEIGYNNGKYKIAIEYCQKENKIRKAVQGEYNLDYSNSLNNLGLLFCAIGNYNEAESSYIQAMQIDKKVLGEDHLFYATDLNNLAALYENMGSYEKAEPLYIQAIQINKKNLGNEHPENASFLNNLARLYTYMGNYQKAEPLYLESLQICKKTFGEDHPYYGIFLNNLASLYLLMGNCEKAETFFIEALQICKKVLGEDHPDYAHNLNNLAKLYESINKYKQAEQLYLQALKIREKVFGIDHPLYANSLNNLAYLYQIMGNYRKSETLFIQVLEIDKKVIGEEHPDYATDLNNLAVLYDDMGNYQKAEPLYIQALKTRKKVLGESHPNYASSLYNLALFYQSMDYSIKAEPFFINGIDITNRNIQKNFAFLSEKEKELYYNSMTGNYESFYSFALERKAENIEITKTVYNNIIKNKGLLLKSTTSMRIAILNSKDTALISQYKKWIVLKKEISKLYSTEISKRIKNPEEIEQQANDIEKNLVQGSQIFSDFEKMQNLTWESVKNNLKPTEVAIEFMRFEEKKDTVIYCALIVKPDSKYPEMIKLCEEYILAAVVKKLTDNDQTNVNNIYGTNESTKEQLYQIIWQPLEKQLVGAKTVYYSPDGLLHKVSFAAIGNGNNGYLCDSYSLKQQSSTGKVAMPEIFTMEKDISVGIFGGIEYSTDTTSMKLWDYLPGTLSETDKIEQIFKTKKIKTNYLVGINANEKNFKETASTCNLLHISTHGFFYPDQENLKTAREKKMAEMQFGFLDRTNSYGLWQFVKNKNPLMRSGLALAYANNVWNQRFPNEGEDGVLTANEVAQLNLQNTQLVVLSACETGLGDIKGSEGVYGLQRAFKMAGVKYIIMSLWQVPDKETVEFMTTFYTKLLKQKDIRKAFTETQNEMRKKYDPYYWAAFVLIE